MLTWISSESYLAICVPDFSRGSSRPIESSGHCFCLLSWQQSASRNIWWVKPLFASAPWPCCNVSPGTVGRWPWEEKPLVCMGQTILFHPCGAWQDTKARPGRGQWPGMAVDSCCLYLLLRRLWGTKSSGLHSMVVGCPSWSALPSRLEEKVQADNWSLSKTKSPRRTDPSHEFPMINTAVSIEILNFTSRWCLKNQKLLDCIVHCRPFITW